MFFPDLEVEDDIEATISSTCSPNANNDHESEEVEDLDDESVTSFPPPKSMKNSEVRSTVPCKKTGLFKVYEAKWGYFEHR